MNNRINCPICEYKDIEVQKSYDPMGLFYVCPVCGRYEFTEAELLKPTLDRSKLRSFLFYNGFHSDDNSYDLRFYTTLSKESCDAFLAAADYNPRYSGHPVHIDNQIVLDWYPRTFSEKIDKILLKIDALIGYVGGSVALSLLELESCLFVDRFKRGKPNLELSEKELNAQVSYYLEYLKDNGYIKFDEPFTPVSDSYHIKLTSKGYQRIDELQKRTGDGRNVLVAMKFGEDTKDLREAIKLGIRDAGYSPILIDEVEHNELITPELLSTIRNSRFVVVDLTHQNNGAYFEEGYAMGLGKPVIQLCRKDTKLHFDIAQKNTIIWDSEADIPLRLANRIKATIN